MWFLSLVMKTQHSLVQPSRKVSGQGCNGEVTPSSTSFGKSRGSSEEMVRAGILASTLWKKGCGDLMLAPDVPPFPDAEQSMDLGLDFRLVSDRSFGAQIIITWCISNPSSIFVPADSYDLSILWHGLQVQSKLFAP